MSNLQRILKESWTLVEARQEWRHVYYRLAGSHVAHLLDEDGQRHEYHSLDEVPQELREEIEKLEAEAMKETGVKKINTSPADPV